jgi:glycosyltransferase involved in cell wall biosynthesis
MNIALVIPSMMPGGVETVLLRLGGFLKRRGHVVSIVATVEKGPWWGLVAECGVTPVFLGPRGPSSQVGHALRVGWHLGHHGYDVVFLNHDLYAQAALRMLPDGVMAIPVLHGDIEPVYRIGLGNAGAWNVVIGVSPRMCDEARARIGSRPVVEVCNGVDMPSEEMWRTTRTVLGRRVKLLFVGRLVHSHKGIFFLPGILDGCLRRGIDAELTVVGMGPQSDDLRTQMRDMGLEGRVEFLGAVSPRSVYEIMLRHHIFLMPSQFEGLPVVSLEAQACGCVPIASRLPGITDKAIQEGETGMLVDVGDVNGFVSAVEKLYRDPRAWLDMSTKGHARVGGEFSVDCMGSAYLRVIEDCVNGRYALPMNGRRGLWWDPSFFTWKDYVPNPLRDLKAILLHEKQH